jgi:hypothetical protein
MPRKRTTYPFPTPVLSPTPEEKERIARDLRTALAASHPLWSTRAELLVYAHVNSEQAEWGLEHLLSQGEIEREWYGRRYEYRLLRP